MHKYYFSGSGRLIGTFQQPQSQFYDLNTKTFDA